MSLAGEVALITGAGRGIGEAVAMRLAEDGVKVVLASRSAQELANVARAIREKGGEALAVPTDVTDRESVRIAAQEARKRWGRIDILVNNAGVALFSAVLSSSEKDWMQMFDANVLGPLRLVQEVLPEMLQRGHGRIVMIASTASHKAYQNQGGYCASKHALLGFSRVLLEELRGTDVRVHVISPGGVDTLLARATREGAVTDEYMATKEVAEAVFFVLSSRGLGTVDEMVLRRQKASPML